MCVFIDIVDCQQFAFNFVQSFFQVPNQCFWYVVLVSILPYPVFVIQLLQHIKEGPEQAMFQAPEDTFTRFSIFHRLGSFLPCCSLVLLSVVQHDTRPVQLGRKLFFK